MLIDTHAHLFWESFQEDFEQVIQNALNADVTMAINVGVDVELSKKAATQDTGELETYSSIAIHPEEAIKYWNNEEKIAEDIIKLEEIYLEHKDKVIAVGECGLDFGCLVWENYLPEGLSIEQAKDLQRKLFRTQIDLAKKLNLPLLLHIRDDRSQNPELIEAWDETLDLAGDHFGILHCYSGLEKTTRRAMQLNNWLISFAGNLTYKKNEYLQEAVKMLPLEKICLETDCPFLPPQSIRGKRNEPSSVKEIAQMVADLKRVSLEEVANQTSVNVKKLLNI